MPATIFPQVPVDQSCDLIGPGMGKIVVPAAYDMQFRAGEQCRQTLTDTRWTYGIGVAPKEQRRNPYLGKPFR